MSDEIVNITRVPKAGLICKLVVSQGTNMVERHVSTNRAVYASATSNMVNRKADLEVGGAALAISENVSALMLAVSGDPVLVSIQTLVADGAGEGGSNVQTTVLTVKKMLVLDTPLATGFSLASTGKSQINLSYLN